VGISVKHGKRLPNVVRLIAVINPNIPLMSVTFLHTADWQLGKPYGRVADPGNRAALQNERFECLRRIGREAADRQAAFVLVAGDLFDSPSPVNATVARACEAIGAMEVPVLVIPGNHDHGGPGSLWEQPFFQRQRAELAPNLRVLLTPEPVILDQAVVFPAPLLRRQQLADATLWIRSALDSPGLPADLPRIVLAHGSVQGFESTQDDEDETAQGMNLIDLTRLPEDALDYLALGDWHGPKQGGAQAWYCGHPAIDRFPTTANLREPGPVPGTPSLLAERSGRGRYCAYRYTAA